MWCTSWKKHIHSGVGVRDGGEVATEKDSIVP